MGRRKFAKNSQDVRHFRLVSRSQNDAYADAPGAGELVLEPLVKPGDARRTGLSEAELALVPEGLAAKHPEAFADINALQRALPESDEESDEEDDDEQDPEAALEGDCYFPQDGYNYEQHLKKVSGSKGSQSAGVVLSAPKAVDERTIKKQAAETTEEADLLRALEFADEYEEIEGDLEDILPGGALDVGSALWGPSAAEDADLPDLAVFKAMHAARLAMAAEGAEGDDDCFEGSGDARGSRAPGTAPQADAEAAAEFDDFFAEEYGEEDDIGACSEEEIEGEVELDDSLLDEYLEGKKAEIEELHSLNEPIKGKLDDVPRAIEETKAIIARHYQEEGEETSSGEESEDESKNWDCETVLSTLSNVSNRPGKIGKIKIIKKPAMKAVREDNEDEDSEDDEDDEEAVELPDVVTDRPKNETPEEKKARKAGVKAMRKICRQMKKESKTTYKEEAEKMKDRQTRAGDIRAKARTFRL